MIVNFPLQHPPRIDKSDVQTPANTSHRERDDNYAVVIVQLAPRWRVIVCRDGIQWILQRRSVLPPNTGTWSGKSYSTTKDGLMAACSRLELPSGASALVVLDALPETILSSAKVGRT